MIDIYDLQQIDGVGYLAAPYSTGLRAGALPEGQMGLRAMFTANAAGNLLRHGLTVISPVVYTHGISRQFDLPRDCLSWRKLDNTLLVACSYMIVYMIEGWEESEGVEYERQSYRSAGKPVFGLRRFIDVYTDAPSFLELDKSIY
jgi:hypothetical protein